MSSFKAFSDTLLLGIAANLSPALVEVFMEREEFVPKYRALTGRDEASARRFIRRTDRLGAVSPYRHAAGYRRLWLHRQIAGRTYDRPWLRY